MFVHAIVPAFSQGSLSAPSYAPPMDNDFPPFRRFVGPAPFEHNGGPGALAWAIFALQLLMLVGLAVLLLRAFAPRRRVEYVQATREPDAPTEELPPS